MQIHTLRPSPRLPGPSQREGGFTRVTPRTKSTPHKRIAEKFCARRVVHPRDTQDQVTTAQKDRGEILDEEGGLGRAAVVCDSKRLRTTCRYIRCDPRDTSFQDQVTTAQKDRGEILDEEGGLGRVAVVCYCKRLRATCRYIRCDPRDTSF